MQKQTNRSLPIHMHAPPWRTRWLIVLAVVFFAACGDNSAAIPPEPVSEAPDASIEKRWVGYQAATDIPPPLTVIANYDDIPQAALGPEIPAKGYFVEEITDGFYWVTEGVYQSMFVVTETGVIVVDAPPTIGDKILAAIAEVTDKAITHVIYSHSHIDHIGAAAQYPADAVVIAHEETAAQLARALDPSRPVPTETFTLTRTLTVGGKTLELMYPGNNHEPGNIFIYAPEAKIVMVVDVIFPGWMMWRRLALAEDIPGLFSAVDQLLELDFEVAVTGHLGRLGTRDDIKTQQQFMHDLATAAGEGLASVSLGTVAMSLSPADQANPWAFFDGYIDRVVHYCVDALTPTWRSQLAGFDVFIYDQCLAMEQSLRIDGPPPM